MNGGSTWQPSSRHWHGGGDSPAGGQEEAVRVRQLVRCHAERAVRQRIVYGLGLVMTMREHQVWRLDVWPEGKSAMA